MKKKIIITIVILAILGVAAFFIYKKVKQKNQTGTGSIGSGSGTTGFPLKQGSRGKEVENVQKALNQVNQQSAFTALIVDGIFGPKTEAALQSTLGLKQLTKTQYNKFMLLTNVTGKTELAANDKLEIKNA